mmetsp:Transcript_2448/g.8787  ORF Transcript_2448/g.8787 Transcript_2448/m.8787 type:complete len:329 (-) Transcript_2448:150-1136(-)
MLCAGFVVVRCCCCCCFSRRRSRSCASKIARALKFSSRCALSAISLSLLASSIFSIRRRFCSRSWSSISSRCSRFFFSANSLLFCSSNFCPSRSRCICFSFSSIRNLSLYSSARFIRSANALWFSSIAATACCVDGAGCTDAKEEGILPDATSIAFASACIFSTVVLFCCCCCGCFTCGAGALSRAAAALFVFMLGFEEVPTLRNAMPLALAFSRFAFSSSSVVGLCCCSCSDDGGSGATTLCCNCCCCCCCTGRLFSMLFFVVLNGTLFFIANFSGATKSVPFFGSCSRAACASSFCPPETGTVFFSPTTLDTSVELFIATVAVTAV